ncbi:diaminopropionate ammonia-lyase [Candidatus Pelagibacter sp.]|nr:diaminopropionate ammonia-lyase [Candidatus Pelagibacter sp.]
MSINYSHINKFSSFIKNKNYSFSREEILSVLNKETIDKAFITVSSWENYEPTPLLKLNKLSKDLNLKNIFYKDESKRFGLKSFKALGGAYAVAEVSAGRKDVVVATATAGNHGKSVAWGAKRLGIACKIFISEFVSETRADEMRKLGAEVTKVKGNYENSLNECIKQSKENGWEIVQDVAWEDYQKVPKLTMAGYSVMIEEISKQTDHYITHIFLQAGVGGMASGVIAGVARYFKRIPKIIIVEPKNADCVLKSIDAGKLTRVEIEKESIMGGMSCGDVSLVPWHILKNSVNSCLSIPDDDIPLSVAMLAKGYFGEDNIVAGECSAPALISINVSCNNEQIKKDLELDMNSNVLLIGCEGDTDIKLYNELLSKGSEQLSNG